MESARADLLEKIQPVLEGAAFAFVFGSFATDRLLPDSDLDLAVDFGRKLSGGVLLALRERLATLVGRDVDLVDLRDADPIISMQILRTGRPFLVRDRYALAVFQMTTPSRYFDWKICRRPVEDAMWATGSRP